MPYRYLFILLFFTATRTAQAQCNPKEYTRIFSEANTLQEKGAFIEAKNRYEAAKIYACNQKEKDAADERVDALFEEMERLRKQAQSDRDTIQAARNRAEQEKLRAKTVIEAFALKQLGDTEFDKNEFPKAAAFYGQAVKKLDTIQGFRQAPFEDTLRNRLNKGIADALNMEKRFKEFKQFTDAGDIQVQKKDKYFFPDAYRAYLMAWRLELGSQMALDQLLDRLTRLELDFPSRPTKKLKGEKYYQLLALSAETNVVLGNPKRVGQRMKKIFKYNPDNLGFVEAPKLKPYVTAFNRKEHREIYLSTSNYLSSGRSGWIRPGFSFGIKQPLFKKMYSVIEGTLYKFREKDLTYATNLYQSEGSVYFGYNLFQLKNKVWHNPNFRISGMAGVTSGKSNFRFSERSLPYILEIPALNGRISTITPMTLKQDDLTLRYKEHTNDFLIECVYEAPSISKYWNALAGLNVCYSPFPRYPALSLYAAATYHLQLTDNAVKTYPLKDALLSRFKTYQLSPSELSDLSSNLDNVGIDNNFKVKIRYPEYNSGFNLKVGLLFRY